MVLFFDFDGVIVDSMPYWETLGADYLKRKGKVPEAEFREIIFPMTMEESADYVKKTYGIEGSRKEIIDDMMAQIKEEYLTTIPLKAGVKEAIEKWHREGHTLAVITASEEEMVRAVLQRFSLSDYISFLFTCTTFHCSKRETKIYEIAKERTGIAGTNERGILFDDNLSALKAAKEAGFLSVGIKDSSNGLYEEAIREETGYYLENLLDFSF